MRLPDPADTLPTAGKADKAKVKAERLKVWKREGTKANRAKAKDARIARWEEATGMTWPS